MVDWYCSYDSWVIDGCLEWVLEVSVEMRLVAGSIMDCLISVLDFSILCSKLRCKVWFSSLSFASYLKLV